MRSPVQQARSWAPCCLRSLKGVGWVLLVWLNARPRTSASVSGRFWISYQRAKARARPKQRRTGRKGLSGFAWICRRSGVLASVLQALAVSRPRGSKRAARLALHIAAIPDPSDHATNLDARESDSKPRARPIFFITTIHGAGRAAAAGGGHAAAPGREARPPRGTARDPAVAPQP